MNIFSVILGLYRCKLLKTIHFQMQKYFFLLILFKRFVLKETVSPRSILVVSVGYHIIFNDSIVNNCIISDMITFKSYLICHVLSADRIRFTV